MTIVLTKLNNITHTRIIKFLHDFYINGSYQIKKIGKPSSNEYSVDFINNINTDSFFKYLKSQGIDYIKENKMKLTSTQKQLVKEYIKKIQTKKSLKENDSEFEGPLFDKLSVLFKKLVPSSGAAKTVEGEMVRAMNRIIWRCYNDGDVIGRGYGKETVDPSAKWLISRKELKGIGSILRKAAASVRTRKYGPKRYEVEYTTEEYMKNLLPAIKMVVDYVESRNGKYTPNDGDSR